MRITVVQTSACDLCEEAAAVLAELAKDHPISVDVVDAQSDVGRELVARNRPPRQPLVLVDGAYFSAGRLPRRKLERALTARHATAERAG
ncbi:glutaredoxin family protein [Cellulomonas xylanilytica]|uniref:glutaredoxin family protein n=1 Tax=Cellulomonas xylanilytica TaxID=233583 RepID=UPI0011BFDBE0|nr:glutaredoxin family protein [Cellulomonas xylanilytica]